jgi:acyl-CoA thioesterase FadM
MARVILTECERYEFAHSLTIRATDINYAGHLGNEALLGLIHETRSHLMKALGFNTVLSEPDRVGLIIADLAVNFRAEA